MTREYEKNPFAAVAESGYNDFSNAAAVSNEALDLESSSPFADNFLSEEQHYHGSPFAGETYPGQAVSANGNGQYESPFARENGNAVDGNLPDDNLQQIRAELFDSEFNTAIYELATELRSFDDKYPVGEVRNGYNPGLHEARQYLRPIISHAESTIDRIADGFTTDDLRNLSDNEIDERIRQLISTNTRFTPRAEYFLGGLIKKVTGVVKKVASTVKKGISAVTNVMTKFGPLKFVLDKIKSIIKPLLEKVLKSAMNMLPASVRSIAEKVKQKLFGNEVVDTTEGWLSANNEAPAIMPAEEIQYELDTAIINSMNGNNEVVPGSEEFFAESEVEQEVDIDAARQQLVNELKTLREGDDPTLVIQNFLPAALLAAQPIIKVAISIIGRDRVVNMLAGLIAKLIGKWVGEAPAKALATPLISTGLGLLGFETTEEEAQQQPEELGYEVLANAIEDTAARVANFPSEVFQNEALLRHEAYRALEQSFAANFPDNEIKESIREASKPGTWRLAKKTNGRAYCKKYSKSFDVTLDKNMLDSIRTFGGVSLSKFMKDTMGVNIDRPFAARIHLYEAKKGTMLSDVAANENTKNLGTSDKSSYVQLHPLGKKEAGVLVNEAGLGRDMPTEFLKEHRNVALGQRFYTIELPGGERPAMVQQEAFEIKDDYDSPIPPVVAPVVQTPQSSFVVLDISRAGVAFDIVFTLFLSENDAVDIVSNMNKNDIAACYSIIRNVSSRPVRHNQLPASITSDRMYQAQVAQVTTWFTSDRVMRLLVIKKAEFAQAQNNPADGVTVRFKFTVPNALFLNVFSRDPLTLISAGSPSGSGSATGTAFPSIMPIFGPFMTPGGTTTSSTFTPSQLANRQKVIAAAKAEIGYVERGTNDTKYGQWYGVNPAAWCAMFVSWAFDKAGLWIGYDQSFIGPRYARFKGKGFASPAMAYRNLSKWATEVKVPQPGDLVIFDWEKNGRWDHIGIVERVDHSNGDYYTIDGNAGDKVRQSNRRNYIKSLGYGQKFLRPNAY